MTPALHLIALVFVAAASVPLQAASIRLASSSSSSITATIMPDAADVGTAANIWMGASYQGQWYLRDGLEWRLFNDGPLPIAITGQVLSSTTEVQVVSNLDISSLSGLEIYVGYGRDESDMRSSPGKLARIYTVLSAPAVPAPGVAGTFAARFSQGSAGFYYNPPTLTGSHIYIGTSRGINYEVATDNGLYKLDLNLDKVWAYPLGSLQVRGSAALDSNGNTYFVVEEGMLPGNNANARLHLYSLDKDGRYRGSRQISASAPNVGMLNPAISSDDTIYVGGDRLYAFDAAGNTKWTYGSFPDTIRNAPAIDTAGNIFFGAPNAIVSLDRNGIQRWIFAVQGTPVASPAFSVDYTKVFVAVANILYCLRTDSGAKVWQFTPSGMTGDFRATPAVDSNNNVYLGTKANSGSVFYAVRADGSGLLWENRIGADLYSSPALGNDSIVYVGSEWTGAQKRLHAIDMATGAEVWSVAYPNSGNDTTWSSPALSDAGILYIASMDYLGEGGAVYAVRTSATGLLPYAGSARFHGGNSGTGRRE